MDDMDDMDRRHGHSLVDAVWVDPIHVDGGDMDDIVVISEYASDVGDMVGWVTWTGDMMH